MSGPCVCFTSMYVQNLPTTHAFVVVQRLVCAFCRLSLASYGVSNFLASHSLEPAPFRPFSSFSPLFCSFLQSLRFLPYRSAILVMVLFDPSLLGLFGLIIYSALNDSVQSFGLFGYVACKLLCSPFTFLGHPRPFLVSCSHGLLLTPLGFPGPITLSFILGAHGLSINPLLSLLSLLRACYGPFSLFYIIYCPWVCYFSLSGLLQARLLPRGPFVYFMGLRSIIPAAWT